MKYNLIVGTCICLYICRFTRETRGTELEKLNEDWETGNGKWRLGEEKGKKENGVREWGSIGEMETWRKGRYKGDGEK